MPTQEWEEEMPSQDGTLKTGDECLPSKKEEITKPKSNCSDSSFERMEEEVPRDDDTPMHSQEHNM